MDRKTFELCAREAFKTTKHVFDEMHIEMDDTPEGNFHIAIVHCLLCRVDLSYDALTETVIGGNPNDMYGYVNAPCRAKRAKA